MIIDFKRNGESLKYPAYAVDVPLILVIKHEINMKGNKNVFKGFEFCRTGVKLLSEDKSIIFELRTTGEKL